MTRPIDRHPSLLQVLDDLIAFMDAKEWGHYELTIKYGRITHYTKTVGVAVSETPTTASREDRAEALNGKES